MLLIYVCIQYVCMFVRIRCDDIEDALKSSLWDVYVYVYVCVVSFAYKHIFMLPVINRIRC